MSCYCRGFGLCDTCEQHVCTGNCTCEPTILSGDDAETHTKEPAR